MTTAQQFLNVAGSQIGYREGANNSTKFGTWFGLPNSAWCAEFLSWCGAQCGALGSIIPRNAYTPDGLAWFQSRGQASRTPRVGDFAYFKFPGIARVSHVGVVEAVLSGGRVQTIEGNTDAAGSRTGGGVWRKIRNVSLVAGFGHPQWSAAPAPAPAPVSSGVDTSSARRLQALVGTGVDGHWGGDSDRCFGALIDAFKGGRGQVPLVQRLLGVAADGIWGPRSQAALVARCKSIQALVGTAADGQWGQASQRAADTYVNAIRGK